MRTDSLRRQTRLHMPAFRAGRIKIVPIAKGGSDRRFYRICCAGEQSLILVKYSLERAENRHYARIAQFLTEHGIRAPKLYFHDAEEGLIWIEDLGQEDLFSFCSEDWLLRAELYRAALDEIAKLHSLPEEEWRDLRDAMAPEFNAALYRWEHTYFFENCLGRLFRVTEKERRELAALPRLQEITEELAALPRVLVHRDFQSQNIIVRNGQAYLIDFQGMRPGLAQYDLASLLFDPYVQLSHRQRSELLSYYVSRRSLSERQFAHPLLLCAMQRLMQALGAYGFLGLVKGHRHFLDHVPSALAALRAVIEQIGGLAPLGAALAPRAADVLSAGQPAARPTR